MLFQEEGGYQMKISALAVGHLMFLARKVTEAPQTIQCTAITLGLPPYLEGKPLLLKTQLTLVAGHGETELELT